MKFIEKARQFLQTKSARKQAFNDKETELRSKLNDIASQKSRLIAEYDPTKPFDASAIDKLDTEAAALQKELDVLRQTVKLTPDYDVAESLKYVDDVKKDANAFISDKVKAAEKAREKIIEAKRALLTAQAEHFRIVRDARDFASNTNETLIALNSGIKQEIENLRIKRQELERQLYDLAGTTTFNVVNSAQSQIDALQAEYDEVRAEIARLEGYTMAVNVPIPELSNYRNGNGQTIYFVHDLEQKDAAEKGIFSK